MPFKAPAINIGIWNKTALYHLGELPAAVCIRSSIFNGKHHTDLTVHISTFTLAAKVPKSKHTFTRYTSVLAACYTQNNLNNNLKNILQRFYQSRFENSQ